MATVTRHRLNWQVKIRRRGYPQLNRSFVTKKDAEAWARQIEGQMDVGGFVDLTTITGDRMYVVKEINKIRMITIHVHIW